MAEFKQRLDMYRKSRHSIADDNRLAETVKDAPVKADLSIITLSIILTEIQLNIIETYYR